MIEKLESYKQTIKEPSPLRVGVFDYIDIETYDVTEMGIKINEIIDVLNSWMKSNGKVIED